MAVGFDAKVHIGLASDDPEPSALTPRAAPAVAYNPVVHTCAFRAPTNERNMESTDGDQMRTILDAPTDDRDDVVDRGVRAVLGEDTTLIVLELGRGVNAAADRTASIDLSLQHDKE